MSITLCTLAIVGVSENSCFSLRAVYFQVVVIRDSHQRVVLAGAPDLWYTSYLEQPASSYTLGSSGFIEGTEGLSSTFPFKDPPYGGPLHLLHQVNRAQTSQLSLHKSAPDAVHLMKNMVALSRNQKLCGLDSGCEDYSNYNLKAAVDMYKDFKETAAPPDEIGKWKFKGWDAIEPPNADVLKEVKAAIEDYQKDIDLEKKISKGAATNAFAVKPGQAHTQILCGLDAGCEDDMASEMGIAQKVDKKTVMADLPDYPDTDTIDEFWKAVQDKRMNDEETDKKRRGVGEQYEFHSEGPAPLPR
jgi:hypothetical protein